VIGRTSLILVLHNNGFTGIDQPNQYSRGLKMTKQKQMTKKELDQVSGGPHYKDFYSRLSVKRNEVERRTGAGVTIPYWNLTCITGGAK
jgi:bacteriocin-like protein